MGNFLLRLFAGIVLCAVSLLPCERSLAGGDFVYRPELAVNGPIAGSLRWAVSLEPQITSNVQQSAEVDLIGGLCWRPAPYVSIWPQFMYVTKGANPDSNEVRPRLDLELFGPGEWKKVGFRSRFEYRMKENQDEYWRYRGRIKVKLPELGQFTPFFYDEVFYEFGDKDMFNGNEGGIGVAIALADKVKLTVDYRLVFSRKGEEWGTGCNHLLTTFEYSF